MSSGQVITATKTHSPPIGQELIVSFGSISANESRIVGGPFGVCKEKCKMFTQVENNVKKTAKSIHDLHDMYKWLSYFYE